MRRQPAKFVTCVMAGIIIFICIFESVLAEWAVPVPGGGGGGLAEALPIWPPSDSALLISVRRQLCVDTCDFFLFLPSSRRARPRSLARHSH